jgi:prepilin-type N-terminal cleavage/methylation domain-containing protein
MLRRSKGFTLIELLVVIAIIGVLSSVILASLNTARAKARDANRAATISQIQTALELYYDAHNSYPSITEDECGSTEGYTTSNNNFMQSLVAEGDLPSYPEDPAGINCNIQYVNNGSDGYNIFVHWESKAASGCNPLGGNHAAGWSCIGINKNPSW